MGRKIRDKISDLGLERDSSSTTQSIQQTSSNEEARTSAETKIIDVSNDFDKKDNLKFTQEVDLGLDISTAVTGVVLLDHLTGDLVKMDHIKLNIAKLTNLFEKADYAADWLNQNVNSYFVKRIFVEANAKGFSVGFSSADTLFTLAKMNALISYLAHKQFGVEVFNVNVTSARSKIGYKDNRKIKKPVKEKVREFVLAANPALPVKTHIAKTGKSKGLSVMDAECADEVDAWVICRGGQLLNP